MKSRTGITCLALTLVAILASPSAASQVPSTTASGADGDLAVAVVNGAPVPTQYLAPQSGTEVMENSEPFTIQEVRSLVEPIQLGYSEGILFKQGDQVLASVAYQDTHQEGRELVVVRAGDRRDPENIEIIGVVLLQQITESTVVATIAKPGELNAQSQELQMTLDGWQCFGAWTAVVLLTGTCAGAAFVTGNAPGVILCAMGGVAGGGVASDVCRQEAEQASMTASLDPKAQTVSGCGPCANGQANFYITGSSTVPATRELYPAGFAICSACPSNYFAHNAVGSTYHYFSPLANCGYSATVWGAIYYSSGTKSDTAQVHINRPDCSVPNIL